MERRGWILRNKWGLAPTDPRWLAMTPELIELEFVHAYLDKQEVESKKESFQDDSYEEYADGAESDDKITEGSVTSGNKAERLVTNDDDSWMGADPEDWVDVD